MQKSIRSLKEVVRIDSIKNGVIKTTNGKYIKIVEVEPINFFLRSEKEKANIIYDFASWLKIAPVSLQFKVMSLPADINKQVEGILQDISTEPNQQCRELQADYLELLCNIGYRQGVARRFFIILEYEQRSVTGDSYDKIVQALNTSANTVGTYLWNCGNRLVEHEDEDMFLCELFYLIFNRHEKETLREKTSRLLQKKRKEGDMIKELLSPKKIHLSKDHIKVGGTFYRFVYIPGGEYRTTVYPGWLSGVINSAEGIDVDLFLRKQDKNRIRNKLSQQLRINKARIKDTETENNDFDDLSSAISSGYYIKQALLNNEDFYFMEVLITLSGASLEEVNAKYDFIADRLRSQDIGCKPCTYHMLDAFLSTVPLCGIEKTLVERAQRNVMTNGAASSYLFTSFEMCDENGILFGLNHQNNSLCILDIFDSQKYKNANVSIVGMSGAGKTFLLQTMALRFRMKKIQTFIIAPFKGHEFRRACQAIGGEFIKLSPGSQTSINILEIRPQDKSNEKLLDGEGVGDDSILSQKIQKLHAFFALVVPDLSYEESQLVDDALIETYRKMGITHDNSSLIDTTVPQTERLPIYKPMPTLQNVYDVLMTMKNEHARRVGIILNRYVTGSAVSFNRQTNVDLDNPYTVVDISEFSEEMQPIGMFVALDYIYDKVKEDRTKKKAVFVDEVWKLIGSKSNALAANFMLEMFKIIRGYGGAAIAATQDINDFFALENGKYGRGIINNSKTRIILQLADQEAELAADVFNLTERELMNVTRFERGQGLVLTNSNNVPVRFIASLTEEELITTDPPRLAEIAEQRRQMAEFSAIEQA